MLQMLDVAIGFAAVMLAVSLIVMSLTQATASMLALRGAKLRRGLEDLIKYTAPDLALQAEQIADRMLRHPLISDAATHLGLRWKLASAIKKEEFIPVLDAVLTESGFTKAGVTGINGIAADQRKALEEWFDSFMARVSQWFTMNTRWIALTFAAAFALSSHFDSIDLVRQINRNSEIRTRLSTMASTLLDQTPEATQRVEAAYQAALTELVEGNKGSFKEAPNPAAGTVTTRKGAQDWVQANVTGGTDSAPILLKLDRLIDGKLTTALVKSIDRAKTLEEGLSAAGITIRPQAGHSYRADFREGNWQHFAGILVSIAFLSLGAPFWFNLLRNMTSLRSAVAQKEPGASDGTRSEDAANRMLWRPNAIDKLPMLPPQAK